MSLKLPRNLSFVTFCVPFVRVVIYVDDIVVHSPRSSEERLVFSLLQEENHCTNCTYCKRSKCEFSRSSITFCDDACGFSGVRVQSDRLDKYVTGVDLLSFSGCLYVFASAQFAILLQQKQGVCFSFVHLRFCMHTLGSKCIHISSLL